MEPSTAPGPTNPNSQSTVTTLQIETSSLVRLKKWRKTVTASREPRAAQSMAREASEGRWFALEARGV